MLDNINDILPALEHLGVLGYWIIFLVAFLESLAVVGVFVPGASMVVIAGVLSAKGYLNPWTLIWFTSAGAILGDSVSYYLGTRGTQFFRDENKFLKLSHLEQGKIFFTKHGSKSILLGRFFGPIRAIVPFIAGLTKMDTGTFLFWNIFGAILWANLHIGAGYFFGNVLHALEAWLTRAGLVIISVTLLILSLWFILRKSQPIFQFFTTIAQSIKTGILADKNVASFINKNPRFVAFMSARFQKDTFVGRPLTMLSFVFLYTLVSFLGVLQNLIASDLIISSDVRFANLLFIFRDADVSSVFLWITILGVWQIIFFGLIIASIALWIWRKRIYLIPLWLTIIGAELFNFFGKTIVHRPRPELALYTEKSFSFPSGHATIAVAFYGFLAYIAWQEYGTNWKRRTNILFLVLIVIFSIGFSRLYLGVHFLSDVWGGYLLGALWLLIGISITEWIRMRRYSFGEGPQPSFSQQGRRNIARTLVFVVLVFYVAIGSEYEPPYRTAPENTVAFHSTTNISQTLDNPEIPRYTETLTGIHQEPLNLIIIAHNDEHFVDAMNKIQWNRADPLTMSSLLPLSMAVVLDESYPTAPVTPSFWNAKVNDFAFQKPTSQKSVRTRHHARFWRTNIQTSNNEHVYVGTASFDKDIKWWVTHRIDPAIDVERDLIVSELVSAGLVLSHEQEQAVPSAIGTNFTGDQFFTDGKRSIIVLKP